MKEQNVIEKSWEYNGMPCRVIRMSGTGHRCGYVGVDVHHPLYYRDYNEANEVVDVHGGLTFANQILSGEELPDIFWFGFDCAHLNDLPEQKYANPLFVNSADYDNTNNHVWTLEDVIEEVEYLAGQLYNFASDYENI